MIHYQRERPHQELALEPRERNRRAHRERDLRRMPGTHARVAAAAATLPFGNETSLWRAGLDHERHPGRIDLAGGGGGIRAMDARHFDGLGVVARRQRRKDHGRGPRLQDVGKGGPARSPIVDHEPHGRRVGERRAVRWRDHLDAQQPIARVGEHSTYGQLDAVRGADRAVDRDPVRLRSDVDLVHVGQRIDRRE